MTVSKWLWAALPIILLAIGLPLAASQGGDYRGWAFLGAMVLLAAELLAVGLLVNGRAIGAFIDNRNKISLSKLQAGAWTVLVLAALATVAVYNLVGQPEGSGTTDLNLSIPGELLLAMGISATSLVAAPALLSLKTDEGKSTLERKDDAHDASWSDLVTGDELGNKDAPDLGKIQQVLITLLLLGLYAGYVYILLSSSQAPIHDLPKLDPSFVWLLGISHAAYLSYKAAPHTPPAGT